MRLSSLLRLSRTCALLAFLGGCSAPLDGGDGQPIGGGDLSEDGALSGPQGSDQADGQDGGSQLVGADGDVIGATGSRSGSSGGGSGGGGSGKVCKPGAATPYFVTDAGGLYSFLPNGSAAPTITKIGDVHCPGTAGAKPYSMAVDRNGVAWVLFAGEAATGLFRVCTSDASCEPTGYDVKKNPYLLSLSFSADGAGATTETLFAAAGTAELLFQQDVSVLSTIDTKTFAFTTIADLLGLTWVSLTGNGQGELFARDYADRQIGRIDKALGTSTPAWQLPKLDTFYAGTVVQWQGDFYLFGGNADGKSSTITRFQPATGTATTVLAATSGLVASASVSTALSGGGVP